MARDPGVGTNRPKTSKPRKQPPVSVAPVVANPLLRYPTLPPTADRPKALDPLVEAGAVLVKTPEGIKAYFPSKPLTGTNDLIGLAPKDRAEVKRIRNATLGKPRRALEFGIEATGVPAVSRSAVKTIEDPSVATVLGLAGNAAIALPFGRPGKAAKEAARLAEEGAAKLAAERGPGGIGSAAEFTAKMAEAKKLRIKQEGLYHAERSKRASAGSEAMKVGGIEGHKAALAEIKGELPKLRFGGYSTFDQAGLEAVIRHIQEHPDLQFFDKINATDAIRGVLDGKVPTRSEIVLLNKAFGEQTTQDILDSVPFWVHAKNNALDLINIPRTIMSSYDVSAPMRQGLLFGISHPVMAGKNIPTMLRAGVSKEFYAQKQAALAARPNAHLYERAKLPLTDFGDDITRREEMFASRYAAKVPGVGFSSRAFTTFLNESRADYFDWMVSRLEQARPDIDVESPAGEKILRTFSRVIGVATGRGEFKHQSVAQAAPLLNAIFFAPRLVKSRLDVIANPAYYMEVMQTPIARREALKHLFGLVATVSGILTIAKLAGAEVVTDPRNADWAKIKVGNTRVDIAAGFQQPLRVIAQVKSGTIISSTTGKKMQLAGGYGDLSKADILTRFAQTKLSPPASIVVDYFKGTDFEGKPFSWKKATLSRMLPLLAQDAADIYKEDGPLAAVGAYGLGMWGLGFQTYGPRTPSSRGPGLGRQETVPGDNGLGAWGRDAPAAGTSGGVGGDSLGAWGR